MPPLQPVKPRLASTETRCGYFALRPALSNVGHLLVDHFLQHDDVVVLGIEELDDPGSPQRLLLLQRLDVGKRRQHLDVPGQHLEAAGVLGSAVGCRSSAASRINGAASANACTDRGMASLPCYLIRTGECGELVHARRRRLVHAVCTIR